MAGKPRREGYLLVDHTFSPGVSAEELSAAGVAGPAVGKDRKGEFSTLTCCHCGTVVVLNPLRTRARGYCARCDAYHCDNPACGLECMNFDKLLDYVQAANARREGRGERVVSLPDLSPLYTTLTVSMTTGLPPSKGQ